MGRLLSESSGNAEPPSLSTILEEEILQVDRQLVDIQTTAEELSGFSVCRMIVEFLYHSSIATDSLLLTV